MGSGDGGLFFFGLPGACAAHAPTRRHAGETPTHTRWCAGRCTHAEEAEEPPTNEQKCFFFSSRCSESDPQSLRAVSSVTARLSARPPRAPPKNPPLATTRRPPPSARTSYRGPVHPRAAADASRVSALAGAPPTRQFDCPRPPAPKPKATLLHALTPPLLRLRPWRLRPRRRHRRPPAPHRGRRRPPRPPRLHHHRQPAGARGGGVADR